MPIFVWKAKDRFGKPVVREISAATSKESEAMLREVGCTDLSLIFEDVADAAKEGFPKSKFLGEEVEVTAEQKVKLYEKRPSTLFSVFWEGVWISKWIVLLVLILGGYFL